MTELRAAQFAGIRWWVLAGIILLGLALRVHGVDRQSLWWDEAVVASVAMLDTHEVIPAIRWAEKTPPLHYFLVHFWIKAFGPSEASLRTPSVIAGVVAIALMYLLVQRLAGEWAGMAAALLLAVLPLHIHYSQEARAYALMICLALGATLALVRVIESRSIAWSIGYTLLLIALLYAHLYGATVMGAHVVTCGVLWALGRAREAHGDGSVPMKWQVRGVWVMALVALAAYAPWAPVQWRWMHDVNRAFWMPPLNATALLTTYRDYAGSWAAWAVLMVGVVLALSKRSNTLAIAVLLPLMLMPVVPAILASMLMHPIFIPRYGVAAIGGLVGLAGCGFGSPRAPGLRWTLCGIAVIAAAAGIRYPIENPDWRGVGDYLNKSMSRGDTCVVYNSNAAILQGYYVTRSDVATLALDAPVVPASVARGGRLWLILADPQASEEAILKSGPWRLLSRREFSAPQPRPGDKPIVVLELST